MRNNVQYIGEILCYSYYNTFIYVVNYYALFIAIYLFLYKIVFLSWPIYPLISQFKCSLTFILEKVNETIFFEILVVCLKKIES